MFKFLFKKDPKPARPASKAPAKPASASRSAPVRTRPNSLEPPPVGEVHELDDESAWDVWEHSQMELDSRMGPLSAFDSIKVKDERPSQFADDGDPFASVRKK